MRFHLGATVVLTVAVSVPALAQTPIAIPFTTPVTPGPVATILRAPQPKSTPSAAHSPHPHKTPFMTFSNPSGPSSANGQFCNRNAAAAQNRVNPITGQKQAATIVSVPLQKGAGSVQSATTHQQQIDACAHGQ